MNFLGSRNGRLAPPEREGEKGIVRRGVNRAVMPPRPAAGRGGKADAGKVKAGPQANELLPQVGRVKVALLGR